MTGKITMYHVAKYSADAGAIGITVATIQGWLPSAAAALSIIYLSIQIAKEVQKWVQKREFARGPRGPQGIQGPRGKTTEMQVTAVPAPEKNGAVVTIAPKKEQALDD